MFSKADAQKRVSSQGGFGAIGGVAAITGLLGALAGASPTGMRGWDEFLAFVLCVVVVLSAAKAPRWAAILMATLAAAGSGTALVALCAWSGLIATVLSAVLKHRNRLLGAVAAGLAMQALLRLPSFGFFGASAALVAIAVCVVVATGYRYGTRRSRSIARKALGASVLLTLGVLVLGGATLLGARGHVSTGLVAARSGLASARAGQAQEVFDELSRAASSFDAANGRVSSLPARALRFVPIAAQHQRALEVATSQGAIVSREAAAMVRDTDIASLSLDAGEVDLEALSAMAPKLARTSDLLREVIVVVGSVRPDWLVPPVSTRLTELSSEIERLLPEVEVAASAADVLPEMLGGTGTRTYFVIFGTPAESRELGGFMGSWALVTFDQGRIQLGQSGRVRDLNSIAGVSSVSAGTVSDWFLEMARPTEFPQNLTSSPDFRTVAEVSKQVIGAVSGEPLSGFVYLDARGVADLMRLTGPLSVPFQDQPLSAETAPDFFFNDQFLLDTRGGVFDALAEVAGTVLDRLSTEAFPGPEELGRVLGPAARGGHLQVVTFTEPENEFLRSVQLLRDFGRQGTPDFVALVQTNALANKMDIYLERELQYAVQDVGDDTLAITATARLRSVVPSDAPELILGEGETRAQNRVLLSMYTPHGLRGVTVNGLPAEHRATREFELQRYLVDVTLPPTGEEFVIEFDLVGLAPQGETYSLEVWHQPLVNTDQVDVSYTGPDGEISWQGPLVENLILRVEDGEN